MPSKEVENKKSFLDLYKEEHYRKAIVDALCKGIDSKHLYSFRSLLEYVVNEKYHLFNREEFKGALYLDEDETLTVDYCGSLEAAKAAAQADYTARIHAALADGEPT